jgi:signal-transduction protein with cAMP-binding, CBS, and nucleotidyltransferase domain
VDGIPEFEEVFMSVTTSQPQRGSYLMPSLQHATVSDAMHPGIFACEPDASLSEVAQTMATCHVHCVAVVGISREEPQRGVGSVLSDLDLVRAGIRDGEASSARAIAQQPLVTVVPSMPLRDAGELMLAHGVSHLVVIQPGTQRPIGILSTADIAGVLAWGEA